MHYIYTFNKTVNFYFMLHFNHHVIRMRHKRNRITFNNDTLEVGANSIIYGNWIYFIFLMDGRVVWKKILFGQRILNGHQVPIPRTRISFRTSHVRDNGVL